MEPTVVHARRGDLPGHQNRTVITLHSLSPILSYGAQEAKKIVLANVSEVTLSKDGVLLTPLVPFGDMHFSLTVACDLAQLGAGLADIEKYLHGNRLNIAQAYIADHGRKIYGPWSEQNHRHDGCAIVHEQKGPPDPTPK